jgi:hypothetical protein
VDKFFKTLAKLASTPAFSLAKTEKQLAKNIEMVSERGKNPSRDWRIRLYFYSPIPKSTRIWRVVIRTPDLTDL